ncbi:DUF6049 family protein [Amycolatopsis albispora]|uniref:Glycoprotein n=1 Tax=Amycolatopsis albispora TaxID=1804986 RepID=A0A344LDY9_9PSEU|nr:DUF6049 family protein [Amycolatopsis albispora]AXB46263.1 hypothetical protein A4R43_30530 [Amycolatopsis albispora]
MKRLASATLTAFLLVLQAFIGVPAGGAPAQPGPDAPSRLRLDIDEMNPRLLVSTSATLTVAGKVTNTGDRRITDVQVRLQFGERQTTSRQLGEALAEAPPTDASITKYVDVARVIEPGQTVPLLITVPLGGDAKPLVSRPGVYPLLVNVNGTPEFGGQARLAAFSMLLPVLGVPGQSAPPRPERPTELSVLWPIADTRPRVVAAPFGGTLVLSDDQLATDLAPGGRLDALVTAPKNIKGEPRLFDSMCFAIDPDLLETVEKMAGGYLVRTPDGGQAPGRGHDTAARWLTSLRQLLQDSCTIQLPYADADLPALAKVTDGDPRLAKTAVDNTSLFERLLGVKPLPGVLWPNGGLDSATLAALGDARVTTVLAESDQLVSNRPLTAPATIEGTNLRGVALDPLLSRSMAATRPVEGAAANLTPADDPDLAAQNALAVLAFQTGAQSDTAGAPLLLAPPRRWTAPVDELTLLLRTIGDYSGLGMVTSKPLLEELAKPVKGTAKMEYGAKDAPAELPQPVISSLSQTERETADFGSSLTGDATTQVEPEDLIKPIRSGLMRASSTAWRADSAGALASAEDARGQLDALRGQVTVETPKQQISLASDTSPLPVTLKNSLPVGVTVRINLTNFTGLRPEQIPDRPLPARGSVPHLIQAEALRTGHFSVDVSLSTPGGTPLGSPARMELNSTQFGLITLIVTIVAGAALLLLSGRRIYRRIRGKDRA